MSEFPSEWEVTNLGAYLKETKERVHEGTATPYSVSKVLGIVPQSEKFKKRVASNDISNYKIIRKGDFAYDPMLLWDGSINRMLREDTGAVSPAYVTFRVLDNSLDANYLLHFLKADTAKSFYKSISKGTNVRRQKAEFRDFASGEFAFPPLPEQKKIAEILSGIDTAIDISCAHLSKVIESRKVVTGDLLANGIGHTSFCDSEIGRMPTKWELITGNDALELGGGASPSAIQFRHNGDTLYMKVDDFNNPQNAEYIKMTKLSYDTKENPSAKPYDKDTIVIAKRGAAIEKNRVRIFETETYVDTNLMTIRSTHYLPVFLAAYLRHLNLSNLADMTSIPQINNFHLQRLRLPMPAMSEQAEICMSIDSLSFLEEKYRAKVQKLELLKSSLSSDLLSGRKRVTI